MTNILLIEDNQDDALLFKESIDELKEIETKIVQVETLASAMLKIQECLPNLILLDLTLPDCQGLRTFLKVYEASFSVPIIILTGMDDEKLALRAVQEGAQDYLVKGSINPTLLWRSIRYALERHKLLLQLRSMSMIDGLTGLYNRRGFMTFCEREIRIVQRSKKTLSLIFADIDGMKAINDRLGHHQGDLALIETAFILRETFREVDILARLGGDEFVVLVVPGAEVDAAELVCRLQQVIDRHNDHSERLYKISISLGLVVYDPKNQLTIEELLDQADKLMYQQKRIKKNFK